MSDDVRQRAAPTTPSAGPTRRRNTHAPFSARHAHALQRVASDVELYCRYVLRRPLRPYQLAPARAILASVFGGQGRTFTVMYARQMGKNELSAALECYLLTLCQRRGGTLVKAAPTYRPQVLTSLMRLDGLLQNPLTTGQWRARHGYVRELGAARALFFSGQEHANVVGATASLLLEIDEAQDFSAAKYAKDFRPMGATGNVTTVLYGTACSAGTLVEGWPGLAQVELSDYKVHGDAAHGQGRADSSPQLSPPRRVLGSALEPHGLTTSGASN